PPGGSWPRSWGPCWPSRASPPSRPVPGPGARWPGSCNPNSADGGAVQQEVVLALLAKEPSHGYQLRARLRQALGPLGEGMNAGQGYVKLTRLEKAGLVAAEPSAGRPDRPDRKVYELTPAGQQRVADWLGEGGRPGPGSAELHRQAVEAP